MSTHSFPKIDQKEYLKKYLSGDKVKKKKKDKKNKKSTASAKVKIIDDDINNLDTGVAIDEELLLTGDDAPQIVGEYIEENPAERRVPKWKSIVIKDEPDDDSDVLKQNEVSLWGQKSNVVRVKREYSAGNARSSRPPESISHSRTNCQKSKSSSLSPTRRHRNSHTPPRSSKKRDKSSSGYRKKEVSSDSRVQIKTEPKSPQHQKCVRKRINSDQSPPRRGKSPIQNSKERSTYQLQSRHNKDSGYLLSERDYSPARRKSSSLQSQNRLRRDSDQSPPRKHKVSDQLPPRHRRDSDQSPPRIGKRRDLDRFSPKNKISPHRYVGQKVDYSPPRKVRRSPDRSPTHRRRNSDQSPPRKNSYSKHKQSSLDQSPRHRRKSPTVTRRNSPPSTHIKQEKRTPDISPRLRRSRWEKQRSDTSVSPPPTHKPKPGKTLEGKKAGLQDAKALQKETVERRNREDLLFKKMSSDISGRNAEVQVRSTGRKGRRAREAMEEDSKERRRKEEHEEKKKLLYDRWGKGLKQIEDHKNRILEQQYESSKPLARYSNDEDLEQYLKEKERLEDPMLEYMRQKRKEKEKQSGKPQIPRYEGPYPENRFGIRPGYRWDGVDRSNGYEKRYFAVMNEKKARQDEAYKYSVEDM